MSGCKNSNFRSDFTAQSKKSMDNIPKEKIAAN